MTDHQLDVVQHQLSCLQDEVQRLQARVESLEHGTPLPPDQPMQMAPQLPSVSTVETGQRCAGKLPANEAIPDIGFGWIGGARK